MAACLLPACLTLALSAAGNPLPTWPLVWENPWCVDVNTRYHENLVRVRRWTIARLWEQQFPVLARQALTVPSEQLPALLKDADLTEEALSAEAALIAIRDDKDFCASPF